MTSKNIARVNYIKNDLVWTSILKNWKTTMLIFYRGPLSISLNLVDKDEVYFEQLFSDFCELVRGINC